MKRTFLTFQTVVETPEFIKQAKESMTDKMRNDFVDYIAKNPLEGAIIQVNVVARELFIIIMMKIFQFFFSLLIRKTNEKTSLPTKRQH